MTKGFAKNKALLDLVMAKRKHKTDRADKARWTRFMRRIEARGEHDCQLFCNRNGKCAICGEELPAGHRVRKKVLTLRNKAIAQIEEIAADKFYHEATARRCIQVLVGVFKT